MLVGVTIARGASSTCRCQRRDRRAPSSAPSATSSFWPRDQRECDRHACRRSAGELSAVRPRAALRRSARRPPRARRRQWSRAFCAGETFVRLEHLGEHCRSIGLSSGCRAEAVRYKADLGSPRSYYARAAGAVTSRLRRTRPARRFRARRRGSISASCAVGCLPDSPPTEASRRRADGTRARRRRAPIRARSGTPTRRGPRRRAARSRSRAPRFRSRVEPRRGSPRTLSAGAHRERGKSTIHHGTSTLTRPPRGSPQKRGGFDPESASERLRQQDRRHRERPRRQIGATFGKTCRGCARSEALATARRARTPACARAQHLPRTRAMESHDTAPTRT